jgi:signal transduction histidine kinase/ligand-binding sensor domain-containing protein
LRNLSTSLEARLKNHWLFPWTIAVLAVVCSALQMRALDRMRTVPQYMRERWGSEKGFPGGTVTAIAQTRDGYLWIGTDKGLMRFDGLNFRVFPQATPLPSAIGAVQGLVSDAEGNLWVLLENTKILRYHQGRFELGRDEAEVGITAIGKRRDGSILLSSLAYGTLTYSGGKYQLVGPKSDAVPDSADRVANEGTDALSSRLAWATGVAAHRIAEPNSAVVAMTETSDGRVWLGTRDKGLFSLVQGHVSALTNDKFGAKTTCLLPLGVGKLWVATDTGIAEWNGKELTQTDVPFELRKTKAIAMIRDRDENLWVGTESGLFRSNGGGVSSDRDRPANSAAVTALFEDREGNLWVGGKGMIERLRDSAFVSYRVGSLQNESGGPIYVDDEGRAWFAPFEGGLHWLQDGKIGSVTNDGLNQDVVYSITGSKHELWVGRQRGGLTHLHYSGEAMTAESYTQTNGLSQNGVYAVYQSRNGSVWAATLNGGVNEFANGRFKTYSKANGMASDTVTSIAEGTDGAMWFGTPNGLNELAKGEWRVFTTREGMPSDNVNCLRSDSAGVLWIGTTAGLAFKRAGMVESLGQAPAALHEPIMGIAEGAKGRLWMATSNHVLSAKRDGLLEGKLGEDELRSYGLEDGLLGTEGVKRERSVFEDGSGRVWFSMNRGLAVIDTARAVENLPPPIMQIADISADGTSIDLKQPIRVPPGSHRVTFSYSGISLSVPDRVRFRYQLEGFDPGWSEPVATREVVYTNLDSGKYRFRMMASNSDGLWNSEELSLPIEVEPVFWKTWWFRASSVVLVVLALMTYLRLRVQRMAKQMDVRYEERLAERTRIARELHDSLLQGFQGLMFRLQAVRDMLPERPNEAAQALESTLDRGDEIIAEGRSTVEDLRDSSLREGDIVQALTNVGEELAHSSKGEAVGLRVLVEGKPRELDPMLRDEIYQVGREAMRNAFQHAQAHKIEAEVTYGDSEFSLRVRDDGNGVDPEVFQEGRREGHWGLPGMRERAKRLGGQLHVWTESGAGTEIELTVPGSVAYVGLVSRSKFWLLKSNLRGTYGRRS